MTIDPKFNDKNEVRKLVVATHIMDRNQRLNKPLGEGLDSYKQSNPDEFKRLKEGYEKIDAILKKNS